jgi:hypothetical protein
MNPISKLALLFICFVLMGSGCPQQTQTGQDPRCPQTEAEYETINEVGIPCSYYTVNGELVK